MGYREIIGPSDRARFIWGEASCADFLLPPSFWFLSCRHRRSQQFAFGVSVTTPRGYDSGTNKHINKEYFVIKNTYSRTKNLGGWYVTDRSGKRWTFPAGYKLREGEVVRVHTGKGTSDHNDRYWGWSRYLWDNSGDRATLYNRAGKSVDWCQYGGGATSPYKC